MSNVLKKSLSLILAALLIASACSVLVSAAAFSADLSSNGKTDVKSVADLLNFVVSDASQAEIQYASSHPDAVLKLNSDVPDGLVNAYVQGNTLRVNTACCTITDDGCTAQWRPESVTLGTDSLELQYDGNGGYFAETQIAENGAITVTVNYECTVTLSEAAADAVANFAYNAANPYAISYDRLCSRYQTAMDMYAIKQSQYLKDLATRDARYAAAIVTCAENARVGALDEFKVKGDYIASLHDSIFDSVVDTIINYKQLLVEYFHVSAAVVDAADNATKTLRTMLTAYDKLTTHADKYSYFCNNSIAYINTINALLDSLTTLYADSNVAGAIDMKGQTERFTQLLEQLENEAELLESVTSSTFDVTTTPYFVFQEPVFPEAPVAPTIASTGAPADLQPFVSMVVDKTLTKRTASSSEFTVTASKSITAYAAIDDSTLTLRSRHISLGNDISITYTAHSSVTDKYDSCFITVGNPEIGIAGDYNDTEIINGAEAADGMTFLYTGLEATEMGDLLDIRLYGVKDGVYYVGMPMPDSICDYAMSLYNSVDCTVELSSLICSMLNYGAAAQTYFGYNTDMLVNSMLDDSLKTVADEIVSSQRGINDDFAGDATAVIVSSAAMPGNKVSMKYNLNLASYTGDKSTLTLVIKRSGMSDCVIPYSDFTAEVGKDGYTHSAVYCGLDVCDMSETCTAAIYENGVCISDSVSDSVMAYAYGTINEAPSDTLANLLKAMIVYGNDAAAYECTTTGN